MREASMQRKGGGQSVPVVSRHLPVLTGDGAGSGRYRRRCRLIRRFVGDERRREAIGADVDGETSCPASRCKPTPGRKVGQVSSSTMVGADVVHIGHVAAPLAWSSADTSSVLRPICVKTLTKENIRDKLPKIDFLVRLGGSSSQSPRRHMVLVCLETPVRIPKASRRKALRTNEVGTMAGGRES
ncbi:hypothetical protein HPP92_007477 [Vanilla planifolia]|uniref:Uncharacterized protein n=1 Tax=Vanilla planifolia TaxID=51239 RepID=A0A835V7R6_VANPL|nr:hypothetical protein HPP92_007477 [Vanilla planifolia]